MRGYKKGQFTSKQITSFLVHDISINEEVFDMKLSTSHETGVN